MLVAKDSFKLYGKFPAPGLILKVMNPTFDKEGGMFSCYLDAYANADDYVAGEIMQSRMYEIRIYKNQNQLPPAIPRSPNEMTMRMHRAMPEVVYGWGKKPASENPAITEADWPSDVYAQAYVLLAQFEEFKEFASDEPTTEAVISAATARTTSRRSNSNA